MRAGETPRKVLSLCGAWAPALVAALSLAMVLVAPLRGAELGDEGVVAAGGWRLLMGQVPARDFFALIPPLPFLASAGAYALLGVSVWAGRALAVAYAAALAAVALHLASHIMRRPLFRCAALAPLVSCGVAAWLLPSHHWLADVLALSAVAALVAALRGRALAWSAAAGALAAACALSLQDQGGALLAALACWIAFFAPRADRRRLAAGAACGAAAVAGSAGLWLLPRVPAAALFHDWVLFPLAHYRGLPDNAAGIRGALQEVAALWGAGIVRKEPVAFALWNAKLILLLAVVPAGVAALVWLWRRERGRRAEAALVAAACVAFLVPALRRPALLNWEWALPPFALAAAWGLEHWHGVAARRPSRVAAAVAWGIVSVFAGAGLVRIPALVRGDGAMVLSPGGRLGPLAPGRAADLQGLVDAVGTNLAAGETLFCAGFIPMVNVLTLHPNPTPFDVFVPPSYTTPEQVEEAIAALERAGVRWVVQPAGFSGGERWDGYLRAGFRPEWADPGFELWGRRGSATETGPRSRPPAADPARRAPAEP